MRARAPYLWLPAAAAVAYLAWTFAARYERSRSPHARPVIAPETGSALKILQFYAAPGFLTEGEKAVLCYGVANARAVRLTPAVEALVPSPNRCLEVGPEEDTRYTLTAEGADGRTVSESFTIQVRPDPLRLPKVVYFLDKGRVKAQHVVGNPGADALEIHSLCFFVENATQIQLDPAVVPPSSAVQGCFYVAPHETTTYTLTALDRKGRTARKQVTVKMP